ncbi:SusC/RagA family TonB-linked outer membrane protein [Mucilaginibacter terrae]|uniref:TonB-linked SusC/RagA family outer membrane protein n=1 Tax=Mucilaginibacter terrae TaxID=1955052 RepID=A0ABU3H312_9SPHI|nr:TonB-dependent receptor [Mucilaginibacter terrae]MDT3405305.1 TonB-linked SusC/RagA family outer membrane protein [Mucilaginibacter terrae]
MNFNVSLNKGGKLLLFMKISTLIVAVICSAMLSVTAATVEGQVLNTKVSIDISEVKLDDAISKISNASGVKFTYNGTIVNSGIKVSAHAKGLALSTVLDELLKHTPFVYKAIDDEIIITTGKRIATYSAMQRILTGKVTDERGQPLPGASVKVKGSDRGAITDAKGNYQVQVNDESEVLVFTFIGYKTKEIVALGVKTLDVQLEPNPENELKEVAVVAFGTQRKVSIVGAQSSVKVSELKQPVANITNVLAGRLAGVVAVQRSGEPGATASDIWIRGISSFNTSGPLVLIDGVTRGDNVSGTSLLNNIDPEDIESFTVLKDASATAVYGVRGANGVILIQTKKGVAGKPAINFNYYEGISTFTRLPEMADGETYMNLVNEALTTRGRTPKYSNEYIQRTINKTDPLLYPDVDWFDAVFNKHSRNRHGNLNITGGVPSAKYFVSTGYYEETGLLKTDDLAQYNSTLKYSRYNFTSNLNLEITKSTKLDLGVQGFVSNRNAPAISSSDIFSQAMTIPPVEFPIMYPGNRIPGRSANGDQRNPYADLTRRGYANSFNNQIFSNIRLTQDLSVLTKGLTFSTMFSVDVTSGRNITRTKREPTYFPNADKPYNDDGTLNLERTYDGDGNYLKFSNNSFLGRKYYTESSLNYDRTFGSHRVGGLLLYNQEDRTNAIGSSDQGTNVANNQFINSIPYRLRGIAARATYSYKDRYFAEFNMGYNGSENFVPTRRYGFFPAFGIGWIPSQEKFFEPLKNIITYFKVRYTNGYAGEDLNGARRFAYIDILNDNASGYGFGNNGQTNFSGISIQDYAVDVTWSKSHKQDLGIELKTLNDKLSLTVDFFKEHRTGIFLRRGAVPSYVGLVQSPYGNLGVVDNKGVEASLQNDITIGNVGLNVRGSITYNKDKAIENDQPTPTYPWMDARGTNVLAQFGYIAEGLFKNQQEIDNSAVPGARENILPGDIKYRDLNNDGVINAYDVTRIGRGDIPAIVYGFGLNVSYKNFNLGGFFQGTAQAQRYISGKAIQPFSTDGGISNAYAIATDRWTPENPDQNAMYPRLAYGDAANANNTLTSSWWIKDASFIRLKTAEFGYTFPKTAFRKIGVKSARIYMMGYNLITISKFKLWDPEINTGNGTTYPNIKTLSLGINAQF